MPRTTLSRYNGTSQVKKTRTPAPLNPVKITNLTFIESIYRFSDYPRGVDNQIETVAWNKCFKEREVRVLLLVV